MAEKELQRFRSVSTVGSDTTWVIEDPNGQLVLYKDAREVIGQEREWKTMYKTRFENAVKGIKSLKNQLAEEKVKNGEDQ